ncbi:MAG TPA: hypothetical protein VJG90_00305 [Candidatus Nanoarchaeia archaeon]|nr:hypothetical protein [Candidatus Nanoarchaeia archaeon]
MKLFERFFRNAPFTDERKANVLKIAIQEKIALLQVAQKLVQEQERLIQDLNKSHSNQLLTNNTVLRQKTIQLEDQEHFAIEPLLRSALNLMHSVSLTLDLGEEFEPIQEDYARLRRALLKLEDDVKQIIPLFDMAPTPLELFKKLKHLIGQNVLSQDSLFQKLYLNLSELDLKLTQELFDRLQYNQGSCPHCHKPYVVEHSNKMDDGGRQYNFICRLCDHIEMATDENHEEIRDRWQMQPVFS